MDTLDSLMRKGYRIYRVKMKLTNTVREYFKTRMNLLIDYHEVLKVITVRDAKSEGTI